MNQFKLFSNRWRSQNCVHVISDGNASIRKYYKQAWNSVNVISPTLFFIVLNMSGFVPKKVYLWGILLHYFVQKKSAAEAHRILVETYGDNALLKTTCRRWITTSRGLSSQVTVVLSPKRSIGWVYCPILEAYLRENANRI